MIWLLIELSKLLMLFKLSRGVKMIFKCILHWQVALWKNKWRSESRIFLSLCLFIPECYYGVIQGISIATGLTITILHSHRSKSIQTPTPSYHGPFCIATWILVAFDLVFTSDGIFLPISKLWHFSQNKNITPSSRSKVIIPKQRGVD